MKNESMLTMLLSLGLAMAASRPAQAGIVVGTCIAGTQYSTIQSAVDAAPSASVIKVCPGGYPEQVVIDKPLTLEGFINSGTEGAFIFPPAGGIVESDAPYAPQILVKNTTGVTITNLIVDGQNGAPCGPVTMVGILFQDTSGTVNKVSVHNQNGLACLAYGFEAVVDNGQGQTVTVENSEFHNQSFYGIYGVGSGLTLETLNNYVTGPDGAGTSTIGIAYRGGATGTIQGNTIVDEIYPQFVFADPSLLGSMGIGVFCSTATVSGNNISNTQTGISVGCNGLGHSFASNSTITGNKVFKTRLLDAIYIFSNGNKVTNNTLVASGQAGIHVDPTYGGGDASGNTVTGNSIVEACAGILITGSVTNTITPNSYNAVDVTTTNGTNCGPILQ